LLGLENEQTLRKENKLIIANQNKQFDITATQLSKILNTSLSRIVADADRLSENITKKRIIEKQINSNGEVCDFVYIPIITFAKYHKGLFTFAFNSYILKYFVDINRNFTEFQLQYLLSMSSSYAIKLYKLLYQYKNIKHRTLSVDDLKEQFGISGKYSQYSDFKKYVLISSVDQINNITDLHVEYKEIKFGRKVEKIEFTFELKKLQLPVIKQVKDIDTTSNSSVIEAPINIINHIESELSTQTRSLITKFIQEKGTDYVEASITYAKKNAKSNLDKYLSDTLTNGWAEVEMHKQKSKKQLSLKTREINNNVEAERQKQIELDNMNRSEIEHLFLKLTDSEQVKYIDLSNTIHNKHKSKLEKMSCSTDNLKLSVFAISNNRSYNKIIESYITSVLRMSLNVNDYLV
jgi:plasmid replication initiation protein